MNWLKHTKIYFTVSGALMVVSILALLNWKLKPGVDFTGGSIIEYRLDTDKSTEEIYRSLNEKGSNVTSIQNLDKKNYLFKLPPLSPEEKSNFNSRLSEVLGEEKHEELRFESVGPSIGPELVKKTYYAIAIAASAILLWIALQFKSLKFGTSAVLAMFHDTFILIGAFSVLGKFLNVEVDFMFVTALLTTLSFSVHDTIVVYDRIRENHKKYGGNFEDIANKAITETMVRSLNNSLTIIFMLLALILLGGTTVKWFAVALLIGTVLGTYSSPFVAVPLLAVWNRMSGGRGAK